MITEENLSEYVRSRIRELREANGLTVNGLAYRTGISQSYIRSLELGEKSSISVIKLYDICSELGVSLKDFFDEEFSLSPPDPLARAVNSLEPSQKESLLLFINSMKQ